MTAVRDILSSAIADLKAMLDQIDEHWDLTAQITNARAELGEVTRSLAAIKAEFAEREAGVARLLKFFAEKNHEYNVLCNEIRNRAADLARIDRGV